MFFITTHLNNHNIILYNKKMRVLVTLKPFYSYYKLLYPISTYQLHSFVYNYTLYLWNTQHGYNMTKPNIDLRFLRSYHPILFQYYVKVTIKSKIYRLYVNKRTDLIKSHLNYGHIIRTPILFTTCIKLTKYKMFFFGLSYLHLKQVGLQIVKTRPYNIFTARGFRLSRMYIYKKVGKVSAYR